IVSRKYFRAQSVAGYLLRHHTQTPATAIPIGRIPKLVIPTQLSCARVIVTVRLSRSLGRIEINSSSDASQLMAFIARSRFPPKGRWALEAQSELPTTTNRPCVFSFAVRSEE